MARLRRVDHVLLHTAAPLVARKRSQGYSPVAIPYRSPLFLADAPHILCYTFAYAT